MIFAPKGPLAISGAGLTRMAGGCTGSCSQQHYLVPSVGSSASRNPALPEGRSEGSEWQPSTDSGGPWASSGHAGPSVALGIPADASGPPGVCRPACSPIAITRSSYSALALQRCRFPWDPFRPREDRPLAELLLLRRDVGAWLPDGVERLRVFPGMPSAQLPRLSLFDSAPQLTLALLGVGLILV